MQRSHGGLRWGFVVGVVIVGWLASAAVATAAVRNAVSAFRPARRTALRPARLVIGAVLAGALLLALTGTAQAASYSGTRTMAVPPASNFAGAGGGDGWALAFSNDRVYNVFHHNGSALIVNCHLQSNAQQCWPNPVSVLDNSTPSGFASSGHPGLTLDADTNRLYIYTRRLSDGAGGVVCFDIALANTGQQPFCGFTALTAAGATDSPNGAAITQQQQVGTKLYAFNETYGTAPDAAGRDRMMCFDLATKAACPGQPYAVNLGGGTLVKTTDAPANPSALIGSRYYIPFRPTNTSGSSDRLACFDTATQGNCAGSWPATNGSALAGDVGAPVPRLDAGGAITGVCMPKAGAPCFKLDGTTTAQPAGWDAMLSAGGAPGFTARWNGPAAVIGARVYIQNFDRNRLECYDFSTSQVCSSFPHSEPNLNGPYTVTVDPQRPTCLWVNADGGSAQIQNFDAFTGGACGTGAARVLASQYVVDQPQCYPTAYQTLQVTSPARGDYASGTVQFADAGGNPIPGSRSLDATGSVDLSQVIGLTQNGLPQFIITLTGAPAGANQLTVRLDWSAGYDPSCVTPTTTVDKTATSATAQPSGGGNSGSPLTVTAGTPVTDLLTLSGTRANSATGTVTYKWFSDAACTSAVSTDIETIGSPGVIPASAAVTLARGDLPRDRGIRR